MTFLGRNIRVEKDATGRETASEEAEMERSEQWKSLIDRHITPLQVGKGADG